MITDKEIQKIFDWADENNIENEGIEKENLGDKILVWRKGIPKKKKYLLEIEFLVLKDYYQDIPNELFRLPNLKGLLLSCDYITFINQKELDNITFLRIDAYDTTQKNFINTLNIIKNDFKKLEYLNIIWGNFQKIPEEIFELTYLKYLKLYGFDKIKELPININKLTNLEILALESCELLFKIPKEIKNLKNLEILNLRYCSELISVPKEIGSLTRLRELDLSGTNIKKIPDELSNLTNLEKLNGEPYIRIKNEAIKEQIQNKTTLNKNIFLIDKLANLTFPHKNILLKGVPGTGKSRAIENIINNKLELTNHKKNVLRINIHSASSNADLMQGIGISSSDGKIEYKEKQGLILDIIQRATFKPNQPFVLILEEIQENSLNELIGDLIYLIEEDKRAKNVVADGEAYAYQELVEKIIEDAPSTDYVEIPYLVNNSTEYRKMIMPNNLYIFCTSNYRDDKKVIEDNLLRRFEVLEVYPKEGVGHEYCRKFFKALNENILTVLKDEIHPDRFLIGHAIWKDVSDKLKFYRAFLKVVVEFKDIKEVEFDEFKKIVKELPMLEELDLSSYKALIEDLQNKAGYDFLD